VAVTASDDRGAGVVMAAEAEQLLRHTLRECVHAGATAALQQDAALLARVRRALRASASTPLHHLLAGGVAGVTPHHLLAGGVAGGVAGVTAGVTAGGVAGEAGAGEQPVGAVGGAWTEAVLRAMTVKQLREAARGLALRKVSTANKATLVAMLLETR
jgi:hypothetical protein